MDKILKFGTSLLLTAAFSAVAFAQGTAPATEATSEAAPAAEAAAQPAAAAPEAAPAAEGEKEVKKVKKTKKSKRGKKAKKARGSRLSSTLQREVEKRNKTASQYGHEARAKDLDRDIANMERAIENTKDEAHRARLQSMVAHLKKLRDSHR